MKRLTTAQRSRIGQQDARIAQSIIALLERKMPRTKGMDFKKRELCKWKRMKQLVNQLVKGPVSCKTDPMWRLNQNIDLLRQGVDENLTKYTQTASRKRARK